MGKLMDGMEVKRDLVEEGFSMSNLDPLKEAITEEVLSSSFESIVNSITS